MPTASVEWGLLVVETDVDAAVIDVLRTWFPTYLTQVERERDLDPHLLARPRPESFQNALTDTEFPDGMLPAILVTTAQTDGEPEIRQLAEYGSRFAVNVSVVVRGRYPSETREVASLFGGCVRRILVHQVTELGGVRWRGGQVAPVPDQTDKGRFLAAGMNRFTVYVDEVLTGDGPVIPDPDDPQYWPPDPDDPDADTGSLAKVTGTDTTIIARS